MEKSCINWPHVQKQRLAMGYQGHAGYATSTTYLDCQEGSARITPGHAEAEPAVSGSALQLGWRTAAGSPDLGAAI